MTALKKYLFVGLSLFALSAHAALFDDKEARKKILDVEATAKANHDAQQATINELKKKLSAVESLQTQNAQDLQGQIDQLKQENAQLKGDLELAQHNLEQAQQRQKDLYADTDTRLRKLESAGAPAPAANSGVVSGAPVAAVVEEKDVKAFADADALSKSAKYKEAFTAYDAFLKDFPTSKLVPDALYGLGYAQFALKNYKSSIATQQKVVDSHSDSAKVPDALYNIANSQIQLGQVTSAKKTLRDLVAKFPNADVTPNAQKRLKMLESIK
ncbi:MAG: tol-pal system protein YbgF [Methylophilaceae bacterium]